MQLFIKWIVEKKKKANIQSSACARWRLQILFILPPVQIAACCCSNATDGGKCVCVCVVAHRRQSAFFFLLRLPSKIIKKSSPLCIGRRDRRPGRRSEKSERERKGDDPLGGARPARPTNIIKKKKVKKNWREEEENAHSSGPEENRSFFSKRIQRNPSVLDSPFPFFSSLERPEKSKCCKRNLRRVSLRLYNSIVFSRRQQKRHREFFSRRDQLTQ